MSSLAAGSNVGVRCPDEGALRRATRLIAIGRPVACDPYATAFYGPNVPVQSSSSVDSVVYDTGDTTIRSQYMLLGEVSPVLGAASIFMNDEPLRVTAISINIESDVRSIQSLLVYDDTKRFLGRATLNTSESITNRNYRLSLPAGTLTIDKRITRSLYFRAQLSSFDTGGQSGLVAQLSSVLLEGNGEWTSDSYRQQSSLTDVYQPFETARSMITSVTNALPSDGSLIVAPDQLLASFTFTGRKTDQSARIELTDLRFLIEKTGDVTVGNTRLRTKGFSDYISCTTSTSEVVCSDIPALYGSLTDAPRTLLIYGDVSGGATQRASLRLTLHESGTPSSAGAIRWTDGTTHFDWVGLDSPIASGTNWKY